jgi:hypothetical protein
MLSFDATSRISLAFSKYEVVLAVKLAPECCSFMTDNLLLTEVFFKRRL